MDATPVNTRIDPGMLDALDQFIASEKDTPSRPEAVRRILRDWLIGHGYLDSHGN